MKKRDNTSRTVAFAGMLTALSVAILYLGSLVEVLDYSLSLICGIIIALVIAEFGTRTGVAVWLATSVLSLIVLPLKISALLYVSLCGWYPAVKRWLDTKRKAVALPLKLAVFNAAIAVTYAVSTKAFLITGVTWWMALGVVLVSNVMCFLYDIIIYRFTLLWALKWRRLFPFLK